MQDTEYRLPHLLLASNSPRRRQLLGIVTADYEIAQGVEVDETYPPTMAAHQVPAYLSQIKARAHAPQLQQQPQGTVLITADTVVILDGKILGKPHSAAHAVEMLEALQGRTHTVVTGVTLTAADGRSETFAEATQVTFAPMPTAAIRHYVERYQPMDKAGAYGIQEWWGCVAISSINGDFYNVMGLPTHALYHHLQKFAK